MNKILMIEKTKKFVKNKLYGEGSGHDWFHIERVYNLAKYLAEKENADSFIVEMTALLHDIDDWKFSNTNDTNTTVTENFLNSINIDDESLKKIIKIIQTMSFKGGVIDSTQYTIEGKVVQDADRLDAIGAIGIARTFAYGGNKNQLMYDPTIKPIDFKSLNQVKNAQNHTINHFYEKLLKLKDLMNTDTAKEIAEKRHKFMEEFLNEFYNEWNFNGQSVK
ncbi:HD domain-containing protein [Romboutsia sp. 1001713B170131_170501_G6]|uniref:HD domain-containing protein n=1 Tax=Romboutsia sp. 1001713B170131_170501_G6 TaxID=2787108 RepID=UPI0018AB934C|nr:HD domain-containing protein [Romboutsia sp. 1001713B170131_170501_G6]